MERQIGDKFLTPEGVELEAVETKVGNCKGCYFFTEEIECGNMECGRWEREDYKEVIFKQTK